MIWGINLRNVEPGNGYGGHFIKSELSEVLTSQDNLAQCLPGGSPCPDNKETSQNLIPSTSGITDVLQLHFWSMCICVWYPYLTYVMPTFDLFYLDLI